MFLLKKKLPHHDGRKKHKLNEYSINLTRKMSIFIKNRTFCVKNWPKNAKNRHFNFKKKG